MPGGHVRRTRAADTGGSGHSASISPGPGAAVWFLALWA